MLLANRHAYDASVGTDFDRELHLALLPRLTGAARIGFVRFDDGEEFREHLVRPSASPACPAWATVPSTASGDGTTAGAGAGFGAGFSTGFGFSTRLGWGLG